MQNESTDEKQTSEGGQMGDNTGATGDDVSLGDIKIMLQKLIKGQDCMVEQQKDNMQMIQSLNSKVATNAKNICELNSQKTEEIVELKCEVQELKKRLDSLENPMFDPERTLIFANLKPKEDMSDKQILQEIFSKMGVACQIRNNKRMTSYGTKPGLLKCELTSVEEKVTVLRNKQQLKDIIPGLWVRSSKSHIERLLEQNTKIMLSIMSDKDDVNDYRLAANGKLVMIQQEEENILEPQSTAIDYTVGITEQWPSLPSSSTPTGQVPKYTRGKNLRGRGSIHQTESHPNANNQQQGAPNRGGRGRGRRGVRVRGGWTRGGRGRGHTHQQSNTADATQPQHIDLSDVGQQRARPPSLETPPRLGPPQPNPASMMTTSTLSSSGPPQQTPTYP